MSPIHPAGRPLSPGAIALMLLLCLSWGFNQIAVKLALPDMPAMMQATFRSIGALPVLLIVGWCARWISRSATARSARASFAGVMFGLEFVLIYQGLRLTTASRAVVFLYTAPFFVALGSYRIPRRAAARLAMGRARAELRRRRARNRRAAARCRQPRVARRSPDRRRRHDVGRDHCDCQGHEAAARRAGKGAGLSGRDLDPDSCRGGVAVGRAA